MQLRRHRYQRDAPEPMRLTDDDLAVLRFIGRYRFLRSTHLIRLFPDRSAKKLIERLGVLYHNQYLDRPRAQLDYYATAGSSPMVYALGNRGADALAEHDHLGRAHVDWTWKNREVGRLFIEHSLLIADVMVAVHVSLQQRPDIKLIEPEEIIANAPAATRAMRNPFYFKARVRHDGAYHDLAVIPDRVFGLDYTTERKRSYFFLEADRGTMPVVRSTLTQTSIYRKLLTYVAGGAPDNAFGRQLGIGNFRSLFITSGEQRVACMIDALKLATGGAGSRQLMFSSEDALADEGGAIGCEWMTGRGERVRGL